MNPGSNKFEPVSIDKTLKEQLKKSTEGLQEQVALLCPDGSPVPKHWSVFTVGELVVIKDYTFKVAYIGESAILFEPVRPTVISPEP